MQNFLKKLKSYFLYGGVKEEDFKSSQYLMCKYNRNLWMIVSWILVALFSALLGYSLITRNRQDFMISYFVMGVIFIITGILFSFALRKDSIWTSVLTHIVLLALVSYGIFLGNVDGSQSAAVIIMVIIIMIPMTVVDRPYRVMLQILLSTVAEIIFAVLFKDGAARTMDITNTLCAGGISLVLGGYIITIHIRFFTNEKYLRRMAYVDSLTGLGNEFSYLEKRESMEKLLHQGKCTPFAVVMFDVNNVKKTDDTYGHIYGCSMIVETGHFIRSLFHTSQVYHVGGDEFIVIAEGKDLASLDEIIDQYDLKMENFFIAKNDIELRVSAARGFSRLKDTDTEFQEVLQRADDLMYQHKAYIKKKLNLPDR